MGIDRTGNALVCRRVVGFGAFSFLALCFLFEYFYLCSVQCLFVVSSLLVWLWKVSSCLIGRGWSRHGYSVLAISSRSGVELSA